MQLAVSLFVDRYLVEFDKYSVEFDKYLVELDKYLLEFDKYLLEFDKYSVEFDRYLVEFDKYSVEFDKYSVVFYKYSEANLNLLKMRQALPIPMCVQWLLECMCQTCGQKYIFVPRVVIIVKYMCQIYICQRIFLKIQSNLLLKST